MAFRLCYSSRRTQPLKDMATTLTVKQAKAMIEMIENDYFSWLRFNFESDDNVPTSKRMTDRFVEATTSKIIGLRFRGDREDIDSIIRSIIKTPLEIVASLKTMHYITEKKIEGGQGK